MRFQVWLSAFVLSGAAFAGPSDVTPSMAPDKGAEISGYGYTIRSPGRAWRLRDHFPLLSGAEAVRGDIYLEVTPFPDLEYPPRMMEPNASIGAFAAMLPQDWKGVAELEPYARKKLAESERYFKSRGEFLPVAINDATCARWKTVRDHVEVVHGKGVFVDIKVWQLCLRPDSLRLGVQMQFDLRTLKGTDSLVPESAGLAVLDSLKFMPLPP